MTHWFTLQDVLNLLVDYRYIVFFPMVILEGPIAAVIGGFLASQGYFNLVILYGLAVVGDLVSDAIYYYIGYSGGRRLIQRWGKYFKLDDKKFTKLETLFHQHSGKTLFFGKITQGLGIGILIVAGIAKMPFGRFLYINFLITCVKAALLLLVGYYFGRGYTHINSYIDIISFITIALCLVAFFVFKKKLTSVFEETLQSPETPQ